MITVSSRSRSPLSLTELKSTATRRKLFKEVACTVISVSLLAIGAKLKLVAPFTPVPFTLQTMFLHYLLFVYGKSAWRYVATYVVLGLVGVPVFAYGGGPTYMLSPTFGYIVGFVLGTLLAGFIAPKGVLSLKKGLLAGFTQLATIYVVGVTWLTAWYALFSGVLSTNALVLSITTGLIPFMPWDIAKLFAALVIGRVTVVAYYAVIRKITDLLPALKGESSL